MLIYTIALSYSYYVDYLVNKTDSSRIHLKISPIGKFPKGAIYGENNQ